ncbi:MAG: hypothetical protein MUQ26_03460, partial [Armatimonadetes bacterium]|nr:hypothetical protein [Armatimonadota bacterium]
MIRLPVEAPRKRLRYEIIGLGLFTLGLLLITGVGRSSGMVAPLLHYGIAFLVGKVGAGLVALGMVVLGTVMVLRWQRVESGRLAAGFGILLWLLLGIWQLAVPETGLFGRALAAEPGGLLGVVLAEMTRPLFGRTFGALVLSLAALCAVGYLSDTPLIKIITVSAWVTGQLAKAVGRSLGAVRLPRLRRDSA